MLNSLWSLFEISRYENSEGRTPVLSSANFSIRSVARSVVRALVVEGAIAVVQVRVACGDAFVNFGDHRDCCLHHLINRVFGLLWCAIGPRGDRARCGKNLYRFAKCNTSTFSQVSLDAGKLDCASGNLLLQCAVPMWCPLRFYCKSGADTTGGGLGGHHTEPSVIANIGVRQRFEDGGVAVRRRCDGGRRMGAARGAAAGRWWAGGGAWQGLTLLWI